MKLAWMFGNSMAAHHLLYSYLAVWLIQGGYAGWTIWQWLRIKAASQSPEILSKR